MCTFLSSPSIFLQPLTNGKRARDDRPIHSLQSAHRVISLAGLSGTAASASILAIDRSDVPPDYQNTNSYRPHQFTHVNGIVGPNGAVYVTTSARNVPTPQHPHTNHQQQQQLATPASTSPADADLAVNPQYTKLVNRSQTPRYTIKPLNTLRKLRSRQALAKAKSVSTSAAAAAASAAAAAAAAATTTTPSKTVTVSALPVPLPTALTANGASRSGRMVVSVMNRQQMATTGASAAASSPQKTADGDDSDTNCSSLDDDDDFDGKSLFSSL